MNKTKYLAPVAAIGLTIGLGVSSVSAEKTTVTIEKGDTLWSIAQQYEEVSVNDLYEWNPGVDADALQVGSELTVNTTGENSDEGTLNEEFHTVTPGSTLTSIANLHAGLTLADLYDLNPGIDPRNLKIGSEVRVSTDNELNEKYHTVSPGSTLTSIANLHAGLTLAELYELNPDIEPRNLQIGQEVRVQ
ncbi:LysM peptidoglycan-binding domain-containing protein [Virgibacillus sp. DJP39]|uniref:LysM peptidoglycan-binding domain-containing protein n=1 Tax=Virgibacillus sp. DJP39 TaxID=3409790 RepID=UPI003BB4BB98